MTFGEKLEMLREEKGMKREELAKTLNISYSAISKYETNLRFPDMGNLKRITEYFDVSVDWLIGLSDVRKHIDYHAKDTDRLSVAELPEEAVKQIVEYVDFMKQKYNVARDTKKKK